MVGNPETIAATRPNSRMQVEAILVRNRSKRFIANVRRNNFTFRKSQRRHPRGSVYFLLPPFAAFCRLANSLNHSKQMGWLVGAVGIEPTTSRLFMDLQGRARYEKEGLSSPRNPYCRLSVALPFMMVLTTLRFASRTALGTACV
jgi:hypothetical protein